MRKPDYPHYLGDPDKPCAEGDRVVAVRSQMTIAIGTVTDHDLVPDGECEVRWDHTDTESWWPAARLRLATPKEIRDHS